MKKVLLEMINGVSLFANVGIAETYLEEVGVKIVVANELLKERAIFYQHLYPKCKMIQGDITDKNIYDRLIAESKKENVEFLIATPPCQGMSLAGKKDENDKRNYLIEYAVSAILDLMPKYVFLENVTMQLKTSIFFNGQKLLIPDYLKMQLGNFYTFNKNNILDTKYFGVPQQRKRAVFLLVRKDLKTIWEFPNREKIITLEQAIGDLPSLDPLIKEPEYRSFFPDYEIKKQEGLKIYFIFSSTHTSRSMQHTFNVSPNVRSCIMPFRYFQTFLLLNLVIREKGSIFRFFN